MKILLRIVAVLAAILGLLPVITGSRVLLGLFDPGYQYFTILVGYNILAGIAAIFAAVLIWKGDSKAQIAAYSLLGAHVIVWVLLKTVYSDIISFHSVNAMSFRVVSWIVFSLVLWRTGVKKAGK
jgi:succinate-acetate transporter protein